MSVNLLHDWPKEGLSKVSRDSSYQTSIITSNIIDSILYPNPSAPLFQQSSPTVLSSSVSLLAYQSPPMPSVTPKEPTPQVAMRAAIRSWGVVRTVALPEVKETSNPRNEYDPLPEGATVLDWDEHVITLKGTVLATTCDRSRCKGSLAEGEVSLRIPVSKSTRSKARHLLFHRDCFPFPELMKAVLPMIVHDTVKIVKIGERSVRTENGLLAAAPFESIRTYRSTRRAGIMVWGSKDSDTIIDSPWQ
jgi:hypothetical protein